MEDMSTQSPITSATQSPFVYENYNPSVSYTPTRSQELVPYVAPHTRRPRTPSPSPHYSVPAPEVNRNAVTSAAVHLVVLFVVLNVLTGIAGPLGLIALFFMVGPAMKSFRTITGSVRANRQSATWQTGPR